MCRQGRETGSSYLPAALTKNTGGTDVQSYLEHKVTTVNRSDGSEKVVEQVRVTAAGLAKLAKAHNPALIAKPKKGNGTAATLEQGAAP